MRRSVFAIAACLWSFSYHQASAEDLSQALVEAYLGNPDLAAQRASLRATNEQVPQALSGYRPQVFLQGQVQSVRGSQRGDAAFSDDSETNDIDNTSQSASLTIQQNLYDGGGTVASVSRAENAVRAGRADLVATEQNVLLNAVNAYANSWRFRSRLAEALNNEQRLQRQLQATRDRFEVGEVARTDVAQAEAALAGAQADVERAKADVASADATYRQIIGRAPGQLSQPSPLRLLPSSLDEAEALADANPEIVSATFALAAAKDDVDVQFAQLLPNLDLQGQFNYTNSPSPGSDWQRSAQAGVVLTIPLFQGGAEYSRVRQSRQTMRQRRNQLESTFRSIQQSVAESWDNLVSASAQIPAFRSQVRANEIALEGVQQEALVGTRTVLDVLDQEQELFTSRVALVDAQANEVIASYQLKSTVGELTVDGLNLAVQPYNPEIYYRENRNRLLGIRTKD